MSIEKKQINEILNQKITSAALATWAKKPYWTEREATALLFRINPKTLQEIWEKIQSYDHKLIKKCTDLLELINRAIKCKDLVIVDLGKNNNSIFNYIVTKQIGYDRCFTPLNFITWVEKYQKVPVNFKKMINKYSDIKDKNTKSNKELQAENEKLKQELKEPNAKNLKSWQKGFIALLALKYGREKVLTSFNHYNGKTINIDGKKLTLSDIKKDLDKQGINIDDGTIKKLIEASIYHLLELPKK